MSPMNHAFSRLLASLGVVLLQAACTDGSAQQGTPRQGETAVVAKLGEVCGTLQGIDCEAGLWCDLEADSCETSDAAGRCAALPEACTMDYTPVCGCDAKTYPNDCTRQRAKVTKRVDGECPA